MISTASLGVVYSEIILSLYPILIKTVPTNLFTQNFFRFLTYPFLALCFGGIGDLYDAWGSWDAAIQSIIGGILNLAHVGISYYAFAHLLPGIAISLFYLYPVFNVLAGGLVFGEKISYYIIPILVLACVGTGLLAVEAGKDGAATATATATGIVAAILAAVTETMIYIFVRMYPTKTPFFAIQKLYPLGLLILAIIAGNGEIGGQLDLNWNTVLKLLGFNAILGFTGYISRFYSIPRLSATLFSVLSYIGVIASFIWGTVFLGKRPSVGGLSGGLMIATAIYLLRSE